MGGPCSGGAAGQGAHAWPGAQALAAELKQLQGSLADLNVMHDRLHSHQGPGDLFALTQDLRARNDGEARALDELFAQLKRLEQRVAQEEGAVAEERRYNDRLAESMPADQRRAFAALQQAVAQVPEVRLARPLHPALSSVTRMCVCVAAGPGGEEGAAAGRGGAHRGV